MTDIRKYILVTLGTIFVALGVIGGAVLVWLGARTIVLRGTTIDWVDSLQGAGFAIDNPNAQNTCACGDSFH